MRNPQGYLLPQTASAAGRRFGAIGGNARHATGRGGTYSAPVPALTASVNPLRAGATFTWSGSRQDLCPGSPGCFFEDSIMRYLTP